MSDGNQKPKVKLQSQQGDIYEADQEVACMSTLIKNMVDGKRRHDVDPSACSMEGGRNDAMGSRDACMHEDPSRFCCLFLP